MNFSVILIVGPTGSGKTDLSIKIAKKFNGEIINSDSTQIFNGLDIATNKITKKEQENIPHHLLSKVSLNETYSIMDYQRDGRKAINNILEKNKIPIIIGGSGLYINALLKDYNFNKEQNDFNHYEDRFLKYNNLQLWNILLNIDFKSALEIHENNRKRVIRAISYFYENKQKFSDKKVAENYIFKPLIIGLSPKKEVLKPYLEKRVYKLIEKGLYDEVINEYKNLGKSTNYQSMKFIGCKEIIQYYNDELTHEESIARMQIANWQYARKQYTWFKYKLDNINWFTHNYQDFDLIVNKVIDFIKIKMPLVI